MPDDPHALNGPVNPDVRRERKDANTRGVVWFGVGFVITAIAIHFALYGLFSVLERQEVAQSPKPLPVAEGRLRFPEDIPAIRDKFGSPPLQVAEVRDLAEHRAAEDAQLNSYGWIDEKKGIVRIPIEEVLKTFDDPKAAAARGIRTRDMKEAK